MRFIVEERNTMAKIDVRTRYTRMVIKESFFALLREKPMEKITVRELCEKAEINRSTFYKHYLDCYDLLDKIEQEALERFDVMLADIAIKGLYPTLTAVLRILQDNATLFEDFLRHSGDHDFTHRLVGRCFHYLELNLSSDMSSGLNRNNQGMRFAYLVGGAGATIEFWLRGGCQASPEQVADLIVELTDQVSDQLGK